MRWVEDAALLLANALADFDEAIGHDGAYSEEVVRWSEAASW